MSWGGWLTLAALRRARGRTAWSLLALVLIAALASSLLGMHALVSDRARHELSRFGPNVLLRPADAAATHVPRAWVPEPSRLREAGVETAVVVHLDAGSSRTWVEPLVETVPPADWAQPGADASIVGLSGPFGDAAALTAEGETRRVVLVALRIPPERLPNAVDALTPALDGLRVDVVRSVALTESRVVTRLGGFVLAVALVLVGLSGVSFSSTLLAQWMERRAEVALMLSLGAPRRTVARLIAQEIALLAACGGVAGALVGAMAGWAILRSGFAWEAPPWAWPWWSLAAAFGITVVVAALGGILPLRRALRVDPVDALRGLG